MEKEYLVIDLQEGHKLIETDLEGKEINKDIADELKRVDNLIYNYNNDIGKTNGKSNDMWSGYCKTYIDHCINGEIVARYKLELGDGIEANKMYYDFFEKKFK